MSPAGPSAAARAARSRLLARATAYAVGTLFAFLLAWIWASLFVGGGA